ncbi:MAG: hypothetical protein CVT62_12885 [Actinobacteria bacterium HGW-Actinobacteria-2]|nr:MAG: hypothetical protein CVT62_12885 [Actinobacteria bacterium HGW-Actinobacteria-2]
MTITLPPVPHRGRLTVLALILPLAVLVVALGVAIALLPQLPNPVATHWGPSGTPDGFGSPIETLVMLTVIVVAFSVGMWALGFFLGSSASTRRLSVFFALWFAAALSGLLVGSLVMQRGLSDASQAPGIGLPLGLSFGFATVLGALAAALMPGDAHQPTTTPVPADAERLPLGPGEQVAWVRTVEPPHLTWLIGGGAVLAMAAIGLGLLGATTVGFTFGITMALLTLAFSLFSRWTVTIDREGLRAHTVLPRPRTVVPLDEVESAEVAEVRPLPDFGGWGYRIDSTGRVGIVVRAGEAILIHRTGGRQLLVTVDDATTGAALLNTLADRARMR